MCKLQSVLGMKWVPYEDVFAYTFGMREAQQAILVKGHITNKREIVRIVMSLFDLLLVHGKILLQDVWAKECDQHMS